MAQRSDAPPEISIQGAAPAEVVIDLDSGREQVASVVAVLGLLVAGVCCSGPKSSDGPVPLWWPGIVGGLLLFALAMLARATMGDCLVVDPRTRTIWSQRSFVAWQARRPLARFDDCLELAFAVRLSQPRRGFASRIWSLWLVRKDAPPLVLSSFSRIVDGTDDLTPPEPAARCARRVADLVGIPVSERPDFDPQGWRPG